MYIVDRRSEPREELLWDCTRVWSCDLQLTKPARPTIIAWETEENVRIQQRDMDRGFHKGGGLRNVHTKVTCNTYSAPGS